MTIWTWRNKPTTSWEWRTLNTFLVTEVFDFLMTENDDYIVTASTETIWQPRPLIN